MAVSSSSLVSAQLPSAMTGMVYFGDAQVVAVVLVVAVALAVEIRYKACKLNTQFKCHISSSLQII